MRITYDPLDRRTERRVTINGGPEQITRCQWNDAGQLTLLEAGEQRSSFRYDAAGRRISKSTLGPTLRETPMTATYDGANRMTSLVLQPGTAQERRYALTQDAAGQLIGKTSSDIQSQAATEVLDARSSFK